MDRTEVRALLDAVATGRLSPSEAEEQLRTLPLQGFTDLGFARLDQHRGMRTGDPEVVYGAGKTPDQVVRIVRALTAHATRPALVTRASGETVVAVVEEWPDATYGGGCVAVGALPRPSGVVTVVTAGTSDE